MNANSLSVDRNRTGGTLLHGDLPHWPTLLLVPLGLFFYAYFLLLTLDLLPTYANAQVPRPSIHDPRETTLLQGRTVLPLAYDSIFTPSVPPFSPGRSLRRPPEPLSA